MSAIALIVIVLAITAVATPLLRRRITADARRQHHVVLRIVVDTGQFAASMQQLTQAFQQMTAAGRLAHTSLHALADTVRKDGG